MVLLYLLERTLQFSKSKALKNNNAGLRRLCIMGCRIQIAEVLKEHSNGKIFSALHPSLNKQDPTPGVLHPSRTVSAEQKANFSSWHF
jgi:hypothetical protein